MCSVFYSVLCSVFCSLVYSEQCNVFCSLVYNEQCSVFRCGRVCREGNSGSRRWECLHFPTFPTPSCTTGLSSKHTDIQLEMLKLEVMSC